MADEKVMLGHGSGGSMMKRIIDEVFFEAYGTDELLRGDDAVVLPALAPGERITRDILDYIRYAKKKNCMLLGTEDPEVNSLQVIRRPPAVSLLRLHSGRGLSHG